MLGFRESATFLPKSATVWLKREFHAAMSWIGSAVAHLALTLYAAGP